MNENKRLLQLFVVLLYDTDTKTTQGKSFLTVGQRICINQERAFLMRDFPDDEDFEQSHIVNEKNHFYHSTNKNKQFIKCLFGSRTNSNKLIKYVKQIRRITCTEPPKSPQTVH